MPACAGFFLRFFKAKPCDYWLLARFFGKIQSNVQENTTSSIWKIQKRFWQLKKLKFPRKDRKMRERSQKSHRKPLFLAEIVLNAILKRFKTLSFFPCRVGRIFRLKCLKTPLFLKIGVCFSHFLLAKKKIKKNRAAADSESPPAVFFSFFFSLLFVIHFLIEMILIFVEENSSRSAPRFFFLKTLFTAVFRNFRKALCHLTLRPF